MFQQITCACGEEFILTPEHIGYATKCAACNNGKDVERCGAEVRWEGKQTPVIEIVPSLARAKRFNARTKRLGASVLRSFVPPPFTVSDGVKKEEHSNNPGAGYTSKLGEKHSTKR